MLRVVLLAACSPNVVAFKTRFDKQADDSTGPTSRSLMFATMPQKNDGCGGGEVLVRHHDDYSCSCESPQDGCMQDKDYTPTRAARRAAQPQKMTYSSNAGAALRLTLGLRQRQPRRVGRGDQPRDRVWRWKADLAACQARCVADATCAFIVH